MRRWRRANRAVLHRALEDSPLCRPVPADADVDELFTVYDNTLREVADRIAPSHAVRRRLGRTAPRLMLTAERYVENAGVSNDATDARILSRTGASGSTRFATVYASTETRRSSTGRTALLNMMVRPNFVADAVAVTVLNARS